jgi:hypothetical protein
MVERACLLLEAGEYPERGLSLSEGDLVSIARNTDWVPVKVEHLPASALDGALGRVTGLAARGRELWGVLVQPAAMWRVLSGFGARRLSVGLDTEGMRLTEVSIVRCPRVASAQVFSKGGDGGLTSVRAFADGLIGYLRGFSGGAEDFSEEVAAARGERADARVADWQRRGLLNGRAETVAAARALLLSGDGSVVTFGDGAARVADVFSEFVESNGVVPVMGEMLEGRVLEPGDASEELVRLARALSREEGKPYWAAFSQVCAENPGLARASRG